MKEEAELWAEARQNSLRTLSQEPLELLSEIPRQLSEGYRRDIEVYPQLWLTIWDYEYDDEVQFKIPDWDHPVQFSVCLSGIARDSFGQLGGGHTLVSGSGVQRKMTAQIPKFQRFLSIDYGHCGAADSAAQHHGDCAVARLAQIDCRVQDQMAERAYQRIAPETIA